MKTIWVYFNGNDIIAFSSKDKAIQYLISLYKCVGAPIGADPLNLYDCAEQEIQECELME